jgi:hypothetical protein
MRQGVKRRAEQSYAAGVRQIAMMLVLVGGACGGGGGGDGSSDAASGAADASGIDAAGAVDAGGPDAFLCPANDQDELGGPCDSEAISCGADGVCLDENLDGPGWAPEGYCIRSGGDPCAEDTDCGEGGVCATIDDESGAYQACLPACCEGETCPGHQACWDSFNGAPMDRMACVPGDASAEDGGACDGVYQCNESSRCKISIETPGGACETIGCTIGEDATTCSGGGRCHASDEDPPYDTPVCGAPCGGDEDCRQADGYVCFDPDVGVAGDRYCRHPHVGDACGDAGDCGGGDWECLTAGGFTNGYCTQSGCATPGSTAGCSEGAVCVDIGAENVCADRCPDVGGQSTCRTDYGCADVDPGGGVEGGCLPP